MLWSNGSCVCLCLSVSGMHASVCVSLCPGLMSVCKVSLPCVHVQYVCFWWMHFSFTMVLKLYDLFTCFIILEAIISSGKLPSVWSNQDAVVSLYYSFILPHSFSPLSSHFMSGLAPPFVSPSPPL